MKRKIVPVKELNPSQLEVEWKSLGRRAMRLWKASGGVDPGIDALFRRMDAVGRALAKTVTGVRRRRHAASLR